MTDQTSARLTLTQSLTTVDDFPKGYPQLSMFINSNDLFANVRRFGRLLARLILHL